MNDSRVVYTIMNNERAMQQIQTPTHGKAGGSQSAEEIDYGDIPTQFGEDQMRAYLSLESKIVMPGHKKRDSFEQQWSSGREQHTQQQQNGQRTPNEEKSSRPHNSVQFNATVHTASPPRSSTQTTPNHSHHSNEQPRHHKYPSTTTTIASSIISPTESEYGQNPMMDRMSTMNSQATHRTQHSFKKLDTVQSSDHTSFVPPPPDWQQSGLSKQIQPNASGQQSGVLQSRDPSGKLVVKQLPYSNKTHTRVNFFVEIEAEHIEQIIVHFDRSLSVAQLLALVQNETNNGEFVGHKLAIFCADEDGDLDDDFPAPEPSAIIAKLGIKNFYIKISNANDSQRKELRRSTLLHVKSLMPLNEANKMHSLTEEDSDSDDDSDGQRERGGCGCLVL